MAAHKLSQERPGQTLQATALVHEAWLRLVDPKAGPGDQHWQGRKHFLAAAAEAMRRILIEKARRKQSLRHGGQLQRVELDAVEIASLLPDDDLLALDEALDRLATLDSPAAALIKLRFFAGADARRGRRDVGLEPQRSGSCLGLRPGLAVSTDSAGKILKQTAAFSRITE